MPRMTLQIFCLEWKERNTSCFAGIGHDDLEFRYRDSSSLVQLNNSLFTSFVKRKTQKNKKD